MRIAIVDDSTFLIEAMRAQLIEDEIHGFDSPDEFIRQAGTHDVFDVLLLDYFFDGFCQTGPQELIPYVRKHMPLCLVALWSSLDAADLKGDGFDLSIVDLVMGKDAESISTLRPLLLRAMQSKFSQSARNS